MKIRFEERKDLKEKPIGSLGFGKYQTDYMFVMDYEEGQGWHDARIVPYGPIEFDPASMVLHYAQETFEGMKAYKAKDGRILLFRPEMNARRFINSNKRLSMPIIEEDDFVQAVEEIVRVEKDWIPTGEGESLYIRPLYVCDGKGYRRTSFAFLQVYHYLFTGRCVLSGRCQSGQDLCRRRIRSCNGRGNRVYKMWWKLCRFFSGTGQSRSFRLYTGIMVRWCRT